MTSTSTGTLEPSLQRASAPTSTISMAERAHEDHSVTIHLFYNETVSISERELTERFDFFKSYDPLSFPNQFRLVGDEEACRLIPAPPNAMESSQELGNQCPIASATAWNSIMLFAAREEEFSLPGTLVHSSKLAAQLGCDRHFKNTFMSSAVSDLYLGTDKPDAATIYEKLEVAFYLQDEFTFRYLVPKASRFKPGLLTASMPELLRYIVCAEYERFRHGIDSGLRDLLKGIDSLKDENPRLAWLRNLLGKAYENCRYSKLDHFEMLSFAEQCVRLEVQDGYPDYPDKGKMARKLFSQFLGECEKWQKTDRDGFTGALPWNIG